MGGVDRCRCTCEMWARLLSTEQATRMPSAMPDRDGLNLQGHGNPRIACFTESGQERCKKRTYRNLYTRDGLGRLFSNTIIVVVRPHEQGFKIKFGSSVAPNPANRVPSLLAGGLSFDVHSSTTQT